MKAYRNGKPFDTEAVIKKIENYKNILEIEEFEIREEEGKILIKREMLDGDRIWGLGETMGNTDKRAGLYRTFCTDESEHNPDKEALYGAHPFFIVDGDERFGVFIDYPGEIIFDIGKKERTILEISIGLDFDIYIFEEKKLLDISREYIRLTGMPYAPPKWAFGYQQSKWGYERGEEVKELVDRFRKEEIPCDAIYLDIDYMKDLKIFTVNDEKFNDLPGMINYAKERGIKFIPIVDPGIKIEKDYDLYEEGIENEYFCKDKNGENFKAAIWPGLSHMPDFINPKTQEWWGELYKRFTDIGIEGFWNDMNEPAFFYTPRGMKELYDSIDELRKDENPGFKIFFAKMMYEKIQNSKEDFKAFYHIDKHGEKINHIDIHNLYGTFMSRATIKGLKKENPERRPFLISRSSYSGLHRDCGIWTGDNKSYWEHILLNIKMQISLSMVGFNYTGADIGGFMGSADAELMIRWSQLAVFTPLFRNHSAIYTRKQEPWAFDENTLKIIKETIKTRYSLFTFIYSEFMKASLNYEPLVKSMNFYYEDKDLAEIDDQFVFGNNIIVAPVYRANSKKRMIYLPEGKYLYMRLSDSKSRKMKLIEGGASYLDVDLNEIPIFIKENSLIIFNESLNYIDEHEINNLDIIAFVKDELEYYLFEDDNNYDYQKGEKKGINIRIKKIEDDYDIIVDKIKETKIKEINFEIYNGEGEKTIKRFKINN